MSNHSFVTNDDSWKNGSHTCAICGYTYNGYTEEHTHNWDSAWTTTVSEHYHKCLVANCPCNDLAGPPYPKDYGDHTDFTWGKDTAEQCSRECSTCGYKETHMHVLSEWKYNAITHWKDCLVSGCPYGSLEETDHTFDNTGKCTVCGYQKAS